MEELAAAVAVPTPTPRSVLIDRRTALHLAAGANTTWAGVLTVALMLAGAAAGADVGASSVGSHVDATGATVFAMLLGCFLGFVVGMVIYSQRRLHSQIALRLDTFLGEREPRN